MKTWNAWIAGLLVAAACAPTPAAPGRWRAEKPEQLKARLGAGRTLKTWVSPNRRYSLIYRNENEVGDFVWYRLYLKRGAAVTLVGAYNEVKDVRWSKDSTVARYKAEKAVDADEFHHLDVEYAPARQTVRSRVTRVVKVPL